VPNRLWRNRPSANAAHAIADQQVHQEILVATEETEWTVCLVSPETADHQPHRRRNWCPEYQTSAHAKLPLVTLAPQDPKDPTDHPETEDHLVRTASPEMWDHEDHPETQDPQDSPVKKAHLVIPAESLVRDQVHLAHLDPQANPAALVNLEDPVKQVATEIQAALDHKETLETQVVPVVPEAQVHPETLVVPALLAVAITVRQLVWHLDTKERDTERLHHATPTSCRAIPIFHPPTVESAPIAIFKALPCLLSKVPGGKCIMLPFVNLLYFMSVFQQYSPYFKK